VAAGESAALRAARAELDAARAEAAEAAARQLEFVAAARTRITLLRDSVAESGGTTAAYASAAADEAAKVFGELTRDSADQVFGEYGP